MLPDIAAFFKTSVDDLLGINRAKNDAEISEFIAEYDNLMDSDKRIELITKMHGKYPNDFNIELRYMGSLMFKSYSEGYGKYLSRIMSIYNNIQDNCTVDSIRICAKRYIINYYNYLATLRKDSGVTMENCEKILAEMPHMRDGQEFISSYLYELGTKEHKKCVQEALDEELSLLNHSTGHHVNGYISDDIPLAYRIEVAELILDINNRFYSDGNYGAVWTDVIYTYGHLGHLYFQNGDTERALYNLKKSAELAKKFDNMERVTTMHSSFFEGKVFDKNTLGTDYNISARMLELFEERYPLSEKFKASNEYIEIINILKS